MWVPGLRDGSAARLARRMPHGKEGVRLPRGRRREGRYRACAVGASGKIMFSAAVGNRAHNKDRALARANSGALVVADQKRNVGAHAVARDRTVGMEVAHLPSLAMKRARNLFPGFAKTDEIGAGDITCTTAGVRALLEVGRGVPPVGVVAGLKPAPVRRPHQAEDREVHVGRGIHGLLDNPSAAPCHAQSTA